MDDKSTESTIAAKLGGDFPPLLTRKQLIDYLQARGYPVALSTLNKWCSAGEGPPVECFWAEKALYEPSKVLLWAESRKRAARTERAPAPGRPRRDRSEAAST